MKVPIASAVLAMLTACASAPPPVPQRDMPGLQDAVAELCSTFQGVVGIYVRDLSTGEEVSLRADQTFPTASMIKVPILIGVFDRIERGELAYRKPLVYDVERKYPGEDVLARFEDGATIPLSELCMLMIALSDNTASLWCQELAGGGASINTWLDRSGFVSTRVNSRTEGRKDSQAQYGWGQTTPREMANLLVSIRERRAVSRAASEEMERILSRSYWSGEALSSIPPNVHAMSKQGAVNRSRSEVLLVDAPSGPFVLCVVTMDQSDESWEHANEGFQLLRDVTAAAWKYLEPAHPYAQSAGADRFW